MREQQGLLAQRQLTGHVDVTGIEYGMGTTLLYCHVLYNVDGFDVIFKYAFCCCHMVY